jgi:hypothetical protein
MGPSWARSSGSTGDADDKAAVEAFWATLKRELTWIHERSSWATRADPRTTMRWPRALASTTLIPCA